MNVIAWPKETFLAPLDIRKFYVFLTNASEVAAETIVSVDKWSLHILTIGDISVAHAKDYDVNGRQW